MRYLERALEIKELTETGSFEGLASVYGNIDLGGDIVEPGAFKEMVLTRDGHIRILDGHSMRAPIGKGKLTDTHLGLAIKGQLNLQVARAREIHALAKDGIMDGLSIGFDVMRDEKGARIGEHIDDKGIRHLTGIKLWEVSMTAFPMNQSAVLSGVKEMEQVRSIREVEDWLRDAVGLSRSQAKQHAKSIWGTVSGQRDAGGDDGEVAASVARLTEMFTSVQ